MDFSLVNIVLEEGRRRRLRRFGDSPGMWPSQGSVETIDGTVMGKCLRTSFYEKNKIPVDKEIDPAIEIMGYMGQEIEDGLIEIIKRAGLWESNNIKFFYNNISGEVDINIRLPKVPGLNFKGIPLTKPLLIVESKSCSGYYVNKEVFGYWEGRGDNKKYVKGRPKIKHLIQSALYAEMSREQTCGCLIYYTSRDGSGMTEFLVQVDESGSIFIDGVKELDFNMNSIHKRYSKLKEYLDEGTLPPVDYKNEYTDEEVKNIYERKGISKTAYENHITGKSYFLDKECSYCQFIHTCKKDKDKEIKNYLDNKPSEILFQEISIDEIIGGAIASVGEEIPDYIKYGSL